MSAGELLLFLILAAHIALLVLGAFYWIRATRREMRRNGIPFQYNIPDVYAGIVGLLPWLWMLTEAIRAPDPPEWNRLPTGVILWVLILSFCLLGLGWYLSVQERLLADRENRQAFVPAFFATLLFQYVVVVVFVVLSFVYFLAIYIVTVAFFL